MSKDVFSVEDMRRAARRRLPRLAFDYIDGGAGDEYTVAENRRAFRRWMLRPQYLRGVEHRDQSVVVLGTSLTTPVILGPAGLQRISHLEGELGAARAANASGTAYVIPSHASYALEDVVRQLDPSRAWFQLYLWRDRSRSQEMIDRAYSAGLRVLMVTVDAPVLGKRERDLRNGFSIPLRPSLGMVIDLLRRPRWLAHYVRGGPITFANYAHMGYGTRPRALFKFVNDELSHPGATTSDLEWLRSRWKGPLVIKGVMTREDAGQAIEAGVDGIVVSNHGGRQIDGVSSTLDVLPEIVDEVGGRAEVLMDGGIRRGTDVMKALALGARAVLIGRPYLYGLAAFGAPGAERVVEILRDEIDTTLAMLGRTQLADVGSDSIERLTHWEKLDADV
jgi:L-lactate dehydrogenase (cytochrome)